MPCQHSVALHTKQLQVFLQTSSSGGTTTYGISDVLEEIELVDGNGTVRVFKKGEDEFNAAVVSMGMLGIITRVTFNLPKKYLVEGQEINKAEKNSCIQPDSNGHHGLLHKVLFNEHEYMHINWLPQQGINRITEWTAKQVPYHLSEIKCKHPLESTALSNLAATAMRFGNIIDQHATHNRFLNYIKNTALAAFMPLDEKTQFRDKWYVALPIDDKANVDDLFDFQFGELWFPEKQMDEVMKRLRELFDKNPQASGNFIVELYAAKQSPFWLSPSYGHHAFRVDLYWWKKMLAIQKTISACFGKNY